jgi:class 3 adenylate cyclase
MLEIYPAQHEHAAMKNAVEDIEGELAKARVYSLMERLPAVCLFDITGYTHLTEERGDEAAADLAARLSRMVQLRPARRQARQVAGGRGDVLFPGTRSRRPCGARDG